MARLVEAKPFHIGPFERLEEPALARHLLRPHDRLEGDVSGAAERLDAVKQGCERKAHPRDHHRPGLDAAHAIDAVFQRETAQAVEIEFLRLANEAVHLERPRLRLEIA